jgi:outer membrane receptor protein involved in Fe transport
VPSFDFIYGSGLRAADPVTMVPNGATLPGYIQVNVGIAQKFDGPGAAKGMSLSFNIVNLFDAIYEIRDGSGVGVGAPQYGPRRGFYGSVSKSF